MPLPAVAAVAARAAASAGSSGAAAAGGRAAAGAASSGAAANAGRAGQAASGSGRAQQAANAAGNAPPGGNPPPGNNQSQPDKPEGPSKAQSRLDKVMKQLGDFDTAIGTLASKSVKAADIIVSASENKFVPMLKEILPEAMGKLLDSVVRVTTAFIDRGRELAGYSGELSASFAVSGVKETMADIKEAQTLGSGMAQMNTGANDIWLSIRELLLPIKKLIVDQMGDTLTKVGDAAALVVDVVGPVIDFMATVTGGVIDIVKFLNPLNQIISLLSFIRKNTEKDSKDELDKLIDQAKQLQIRIGDENFRRDNGPAPQLPMNLGLFAGL